MNMIRTLQAAAICGVLSMSTAAFADNIEITVFQDGTQVYQTSTTGTTLNLSTTQLSTLNGNLAAGANQFTVNNFGVTATDLPIIGSLVGSGTVATSSTNFSSGEYLTIEITYDAFTTPNTVNTMTSSSSYTDIDSAGSTLSFTSTVGANGTLNAPGTSSPLSTLTIPAGISEAGSQTAPNTIFSPVSPGYTLTETFVWNPDSTQDQLNPTGTTTAYFTAPEGGIGLMYLLLAAMTFGGGLALKRREA